LDLPCLFQRCICVVNVCKVTDLIIHSLLHHVKLVKYFCKMKYLFEIPFSKPSIHAVAFSNNEDRDERSSLICDISVKVPYCGTNSVFLDQLFLHFCNSIFCQNCAGSEKNVLL